MAAAAMIRQTPAATGALASGPAARSGRARRPGRGRAGRDVDGERGQVGVGPRGERLARSRVEFVFGQPTVHERVL